MATIKRYNSVTSSWEIVAAGKNGTNGTNGTNATIAAEASTGTAIQFDKKRNYGHTTALTDNLTLNTTGAIPGAEAIIRHNHSAAPGVPTEWKRLAGDYKVSVDNYIVVYCFTTSLYLYTISQVKP